jgi:hypothetical protein
MVVAFDLALVLHYTRRSALRSQPAGDTVQTRDGIRLIRSNAQGRAEVVGPRLRCARHTTGSGAEQCGGPRD